MEDSISLGFPTGVGSLQHRTLKRVACLTIQRQSSALDPALCPGPCLLNWQLGGQLDHSPRITMEGEEYATLGGAVEPCRSTPFLYGLPQLQNQSAAPLPKLSFQGAWAEMKPG